MGRCDGQGIMSFGENLPRKWSDCSNEDLNDWYRRKGFACFGKDKPRQLSCGPDQPVKVELDKTNNFYVQNFGSNQTHSHFQRLKAAVSAYHLAYHSVLVQPCAVVIAHGAQANAKPNSL